MKAGGVESNNSFYSWGESIRRKYDDEIRNIRDQG
jgi:hypothetical protein